MHVGIQVWSKFKTKSENKVLNLQKDEDIALIMNVGISISDVSNTFRPVATATAWAKCIMTEFFHQADQERKESLTITTNTLARDVCNIPKCQIAFISKSLNYPELKIFYRRGSGQHSSRLGCLAD